MGRRRGALALVVGALAVLHFALHLTLGLGGVAPDLLIVSLLLLARHVGMGVSAGVGFAFGLLEDALSLATFGVNTVSLAVVGALGARTRDLFVGDSVLFMVVYLALGKWLRDALHWLLVGPALREEFVAALVVQAPLGALYAAGVGLVAAVVTGMGRE